MGLSCIVLAEWLLVSPDVAEVKDVKICSTIANASFVQVKHHVLFFLIVGFVTKDCVCDEVRMIAMYDVGFCSGVLFLIFISNT